MKTITLGEVISPAKTVRCGNGNYPVLSMTMHDGIVLQSERFSKNLASNDTSNYKVVCAGQLVVGFPIDEGVLYIQRCVSSGIMSPAYNVWDIDTGVIDDEYLELILHSPKAMQYYKDNLRGSTARRRSLPNSTLLAFEFNLPAITVQKEYVDLIKKQNELIGIKKQQLNSFDELVKSRFIEMFGDVVNNPKYDGIPLGTICSTLSGGTPTTKVPEYYQGDIPWISTPYLGNNHINGSSAKAYITEDAIKNSATHLIPENTIMFGIRVGVGKSSIIDVPMCANQDIVALMGIDTNEYNLLFIKHTLDSYQSHFDSIKKGATILGITTEDLKKVLIPVVEMELQDQFAAFVEQTDKLKFDGIKIINLCEILKIKSWRRES